MTNRNKHNDGKEGQNVKGRKGNIPLREFDNKRDVYWNKVADDWVEKNKEHRPAPMPPMSPFSQGRSMLDNDMKELNSDKSAWQKLLYWVIFKTSYHVGFVYFMLKGLILRRW